jgi:hypothetical protein
MPFDAQLVEVGGLGGVEWLEREVVELSGVLSHPSVT